MDNLKVMQIIIFVTLGFIFGVIFWELIGPKLIMSDRVELCESLGGRYQYYWYSYEKEYVEKCERMPGYINLN